MERKKNIAYVAGCSGGHITPALTLARQQNTPTVFFTRNHPIDKNMFPKNHNCSAIIYLPLATTPRKKIVSIILFLQQFIRSFFISIHQLHAHNIGSIVTTGSYIALPVCLAGWFLRIPITLYEFNVESGKAIRALAPLATTINICFPQTAYDLSHKKCILSSYPIRMTEKDKNYNPSDIIKHLGFDNNRKTLFILGGSQGSDFLNDTIIEVFTRHPELTASWQIIHQTGSEHATIQQKYSDLSLPSHVFSYEQHLAPYFCTASIIISRAGAGSLAEILFFNKKAIIVPHKNKTTNHQEQNARALAHQNPQSLLIINQDQNATEHIARELKKVI
jgi:UDP-N-acetylglucosamine--N-acetylmuramyl-(pentapeptide) pyrophosphoryl-undecaprenol N-acetylglucosamine transferase